jgi:ABC-type polysaccharide/polyol phosphate transport system ATPase subunit
MDEIIISLKHVSKKYKYFKNNRQRINSVLLGMNTGHEIEVLKDVTFDICKGEKVGIIGKLGSGRSTTMRIIAGVLAADGGEVIVNKEPFTIFEHKLGFDAGLSIRDNILMRGTLMGWSKAEIKEKEHEIAEFSDTLDGIDRPLKTFPAGTANRLGFTMETMEVHDLVLFDENFVAGGAKYLSKTIKRFISTIGEETTLLMNTSNLEIAQKLCTRGLVLDEGVICFSGPFDEAVTYYRTNCRPSPKSEKARKKKAREEREEYENDLRDDDNSSDDDVF